MTRKYIRNSIMHERYRHPSFINDRGNHIIQRIFHPIGQGAFYAEKHPNFNIVYDCGIIQYSKHTQLADEVVKNSFSPKSEIDILFISHFDFDHISKIKVLKETFAIKIVVLPLLYKEEETLLINIYNNIELPPYITNDILNLIQNPQEYFGGGVTIIKVSDNNEGVVEGYLDIEEADSLPTEINSGRRIRRGDWVFVPYNLHYKNRRGELEKIFKKKGLDIEKFKNKAVDNLYYYVTTKTERQKLRQAYNQLNGGINQNSMMLYSGPARINENYFCRIDYKYLNYSFNHYKTHRVGCVYTGDGDLNESKISDIYKAFWQNVGTIQIPHHGSLKSFNIKELDDNYYACPISVGENRYGHPSGQVICDIIESGSSPVLITEHANSIFIEEIGVVSEKCKPFIKMQNEQKEIMKKFVKKDK